MTKDLNMNEDKNKEPSQSLTNVQNRRGRPKGHDVSKETRERIAEGNRLSWARKKSDPNWIPSVRDLKAMKKQIGRQPGHEVTQATRDKISAKMLERNKLKPKVGRPAGGAQAKLKNTPSAHTGVRNNWIWNRIYGWYITSYTCSVCSVYTKQDREITEQHASLCQGWRDPYDHPEGAPPKDEFWVRLKSGQIVKQEERQ